MTSFHQTRQLYLRRQQQSYNADIIQIVALMRRKGVTFRDLLFYLRDTAQKRDLTPNELVTRSRQLANGQYVEPLDNSDYEWAEEVISSLENEIDVTTGKAGVKPESSAATAGSSGQSVKPARAFYSKQSHKDD